MVIASDGAGAIVRRLHDLASDDVKTAKFRLAALRKVLAEHTAEDRLAYIVSKVTGVAVPALTPPSPWSVRPATATPPGRSSTPIVVRHIGGSAWSW
jgi:hypothetical protein